MLRAEKVPRFVTFVTPPARRRRGPERLPKASDRHTVRANLGRKLFGWAELPHRLLIFGSSGPSKDELRDARDRRSFPIGLVPSFTASTLSKLTNVQTEHCRLRRKRLLGLLEQFNRHLTTFSHLLCSQDSTMEVKSQRRKHLKRDHALHSLNAAIDALHLAKDTTNVRQARDVFASTSSLLATTRVCLFPVSVHQLLVI